MACVCFPFRGFLFCLGWGKLIACTALTVEIKKTKQRIVWIDFFKKNIWVFFHLEFYVIFYSNSVSINLSSIWASAMLWIAHTLRCVKRIETAGIWYCWLRVALTGLETKPEVDGNDTVMTVEPSHLPILGEKSSYAYLLV